MDKEELRARTVRAIVRQFSTARPRHDLNAQLRVDRVDIGVAQTSWNREPTSAFGRLVHRLGLQPRPTQDWIVLRSFNRVGDATNFQELETAVREATEELRALDLHDSVFVTLDTIEGTDPKAAGGPIPVKIHLHLKEKQKMTIGTTATGSVSGREAGLEAEMAMSNYFGTAERINYKYSLDLTRSSFYEGSFTKPLLARGQNEQVGVNVVKETLNNSDQSSHKQDRLGFHARYQRQNHQLSYELSWREISLTDKPTQPMLDEGGHSVKSSIKHVWSRDSRNDGLIPTIGSAVRVSNELAGLGGSVRFIKSEVDVQHNVPLTPTADWSLSFLGKAGVHVPFGGSRSHISDRFFVGGPGSFRGFGAKGLGPRYKHDSYGGDVFWNASAHLIGLLRDVNNLGLFYGHLFAQAGNNVRLPQWRQVVVGSGKPGNGDEVRTSVGAGVVWRMPVGARVEFNYVWPLNAQPNDVQNPGPQVGMSVAFL